MRSTKKLAMAALLALGLLALFAGPASAMKYSLKISNPEPWGAGYMEPRGMATDSLGNLYVANWRSSGPKIDKYNSSGKLLSSFVPTGQADRVKDVDVDSAGNIWAVSEWTMTKYSPTGTLLKEVKYSPLGDQFDAVSAGAPTGFTYAVTPSLAAWYDNNGNFLSGYGVSGGAGEPTSDIDVDSASRSWVSKPWKGIWIYDLNAKKSLPSIATPTRPAGVAADNSGNAWVAEPQACRVRKYSLAGVVLDSFGECEAGNLLAPGKLNSSLMRQEEPGIAWGPGGVVWVVNGPEIQKWVP